MRMEKNVSIKHKTQGMKVSNVSISKLKDLQNPGPANLEPSESRTRKGI